MEKTNKVLKYLLLFLLVVIVLYYITPKILYNYFIFPITKENKIYLFGDWSVIISAIKCKYLNYNVFLDNPCDMLGRRHVYGAILLYIPYIEKYNIFYLLYFPIIINLIFIFVILIHFNFESIKEYFLFFTFIFNPSTLLLMERLNIDIFIFLFLVLLCYLKKNILNLFFVSSLTLAKFYPILFFPLFFLKNYNKLLKNFIYFTSCLALIFTFLYLEKNNLIVISRNSGQFSAYYPWSFNFFALSKIPTLLSIFSKDQLIFSSFLLFVTFCYLGIFFSKKIIIGKGYILDSLVNRGYHESLFFISAGIFVSTYFAFNNWIYREIFLFGLLPFFIKLSKKDIIFRNLINFIIFRLVFFSISSYFSIFKKNDFLLIFNQMIDICLVSFVCGIILWLYFRLIINFFILKKFI
jgi:hypothetical protein